MLKNIFDGGGARFEEFVVGRNEEQSIQSGENGKNEIGR